DHLQLPKPALASEKPESQAKPDTSKKKDAAQGQALFEAFTPESEETKSGGTSGSYKHLAEALSGLVEAEAASEQRPGKAGESSQAQPEGDKGRKLSRAKEKSSGEPDTASSPPVQQAPSQPGPASKPTAKFEPPPKPELAPKPEAEKLTGLAPT